MKLESYNYFKLSNYAMAPCPVPKYLDYVILSKRDIGHE